MLAGGIYLACGRDLPVSAVVIFSLGPFTSLLLQSKDSPVDSY